MGVAERGIYGVERCLAKKMSVPDGRGRLKGRKQKVRLPSDKEMSLSPCGPGLSRPGPLETRLDLALNGHQLRAASRVLDRFDSVFSGEPPHKQCQLAVGCSLDGSPIHSLHIFRGASTSTVHFHNKLDVFHSFSVFILRLLRDSRVCNTSTGTTSGI